MTSTRCLVPQVQKSGQSPKRVEVNALHLHLSVTSPCFSVNDRYNLPNLMKLLPRFSTLGLPLLLICPAHAAVNPAIVSADARWVVSINLDELRETVLGKQLMVLAQDVMPKPQMNNFQIDFQKLQMTIGTLTAYGTNFSSDPKQIDGALVAQGTADLRKIAEALVLQGTLTTPDKVKEVKDLPFTAYEIGGEVLVAFPPEPIVIVSKSRAQLVKARDVFRGAAPSLAKSPDLPLAVLLTKSGPGYFSSASVVPTDKLFAAETPQTRIFQLMSSWAMAVGEEDQKTTTHLRMLASSDDMADKLLKIAQGMVAMASLAETSDKQLQEFVQSATVNKQDRMISVDMAYSSERIVQMIKTVRDQAAPPPMPGPGAPRAPIPPVSPGHVVAQWPINEAAPGSVAGPDTLKDHAIDNVALVNGSTITLIARRDANGHGVIDCVDILPAGGNGTPLHFEAESMRLTGFQVRTAAYASRGKLIGLRGSYGTAQFDFPGEDGKYLIRVRYVDEPGGKSSLAVNVKDPDPVPAAVDSLPASAPEPAAIPAAPAAPAMPAATK